MKWRTATAEEIAKYDCTNVRKSGDSTRIKDHVAAISAEGTVPGRPDLRYRQTTDYTSAVADGYPGGGPSGMATVFCDALVPEVASRLRMSEEKVREVIREYGKVCQDSLLRGQPIGIPYVGALYVRRIHAKEPTAERRKLYLEKAKRNYRVNTLADAEKYADVVLERTSVDSARVCFQSSAALMDIFSVNCKVGPWPNEWRKLLAKQNQARKATRHKPKVEDEQESQDP